MSLERREFLRYVGVGAIATTIRPALPPAQGGMPRNEQKIHSDFRSNNPGVEYFLLGNGQILTALQVSPKPELGTHCGLLVSSSDHFCRKMSTYLFHPERGLQNTRFTLNVGGKAYGPDYEKSSIHWEQQDKIPTIVVEWTAGDCSVREELMCPIGDPALVRTITVVNKSSSPVKATGTILLYPNLMLFDEYHVDREKATLNASGYASLELFCLNDATPGDRHLNILFGEVAPGATKTSTVVLTLNQPRATFEKKGLRAMRRESQEYWSRRAVFETNHAGLNHMFQSAVTGLRSAVSLQGKMDAGIWQYNFEWVRDQSMIAAGSSLCGHTDVAEASLRRILDRSIDTD